MKMPSNLFFFVILFHAMTANAAELTIEVFTQSYIEPTFVSGHKVAYYSMDAPDRLNKALPHFGTDALMSEQKARQWLQANGQAFVARLQEAQQGRLKALEYQITKLPAIVFNRGTQVVYGTTDVLSALRVFNRAENQK